ncbi:MAG TPA: molybdopterin cofactor-binding domain-containing protein [Bryobacteraceae bacterium]|jgi:isoquinoline 1-oxidoreductase beta subunit|nr:molybdopterin cofactor-binding domain-containing protein [Bryobacteraceae bacterium]
MAKLKRRHFIGYAAGSVGVLAVGWSILPPRQRLTPGSPLPTAPGQVALNGWVKVSPDDTVTIVMTQAEMGQGIHTSLAMLLADEMDAAWDRVKLEQSTLDKIYNNQAEILDGMPFQPDDNGYGKRAARWMVAKIIREVPGALGTGGSSSVNDLWLPMREAGASARAALIAAAADTWKVPAGECRTEAGRVLHSSGKTASYGQLAARAGQMGVPRNVALKDPAAFKLIGKPVKRLDNALKIHGAGVFSIDIVPPGLLYASVKMCPTLGGKVARFDGAGAQSLPGVRRVVELQPYAGGLASYGSGTGGVAVIADTPYHAMRAVEKVAVEWDHGPAANLSTDDAFRALSQALDANKGKAHLEHGDVDAALKGAAKTIRAEYRAPFLAHATMEPMNCTVQFKDGAATVWAPAQGPAFAVNAVAGVLGIKADKVTLIIPLLGGGFGRRTFVDVVSQAAAIAKEAGGAPVQTMWSREEDMTHDYYRPAFVSRHEAGFDAQGKPVAWKATTAGSSLGAPSFIDGASKGASDAGYRFPNARVAHQGTESLVPVGIWRSVGHSYNAFFTESFIDESAAAAGQDAVAFRAALLAGKPRILRVLKRAAELSGWGQPPAPAADGAKTARGIAVHPCFDSVIANVAEVSIDSERKIRVHRVMCVVDCGFPLNPNVIRQQLEGGIVFGLSAALQGEITVEKGQVQQSNFDKYAPLRMRECPVIETDIIPSEEHPGGIGETGVPTIAPAVANAVFALTGQRLRSLPLKLPV